MSVAVADSHALIWYVTGPQKKLGPRARSFFDRAERGVATVFVPTFALIEISEATRRGVVNFQQGFGRWMPSFLDGRRFVAVDLSVDVVLAAEALYAIPDRGDRLIAATASHLECPLISRDPEIARVAGIQTIW